MSGLDLYCYSGGFDTPEQARVAWERIQVVAKEQVPGGAGGWNLQTRANPPRLLL